MIDRMLKPILVATEKIKDFIYVSQQMIEKEFIWFFFSAGKTKASPLRTLIGVLNSR